MRIDWPVLIRALTPKHGDVKRLAYEMDKSGLPVKWRSLSRWRRGVQTPSADTAVWLVEEARRIGVDVPRKT